jgi:hypothetical protein
MSTGTSTARLAGSSISFCAAAVEICNAAGVVGFGLAFHDAGHGGELAAHLVDHLGGGAADLRSS